MPPYFSLVGFLTVHFVHHYETRPTNLADVRFPVLYPKSMRHLTYETTSGYLPSTGTLPEALNVAHSIVQSFPRRRLLI
jgi:hypothetical protein